MTINKRAAATSSSVLTRARRPLAALYGIAALLLAPWIVVLAVTQPHRGMAVHNDRLRLTLLVLIILLAAVTLIRPRTAPLAGSAAATVGATTAWFYGLTRTTAPVVFEAVGITGLLITAVAAGWLAVAALSEAVYGVRSTGKLKIARWVLGVAVVGIAIMVVRPIRAQPSIAEVDHLALAWVGLDLAELIALAALAYSLWSARQWTVLAASVTAFLLAVDAIVNIIPTAGEARAEALAMAFVELPLSVSALAVGLLCLRDLDAAASRRDDLAH